MMLDRFGRESAAAEIVGAIKALLVSREAPEAPDLGGNANTANITKALLGVLLR